MTTDLDGRVRDVLDTIVAASPDPGPTPHLEGLEGAGTGDQRRARRWPVAVAASLLLLGGLGALFAASGWRSGGGASAPTDVDSTELDATLLQPRDTTSLPQVPTPSLAGWTVEVDAVGLGSQMSDSGVFVASTLRRDDEQLRMTVTSGDVGLPDDVVEIDRPGGTVEAALIRAADGEWLLAWTEHPVGAEAFSISLTGAPRTLVVEVAEEVELVRRPLLGADVPSTQRIGDLEPVLAGSLDGAEWQIGLGAQPEAPVVVVEGVSPEIYFETTVAAPLEAPVIDMVTVSRDGAQVSGVLVADPAANVQLVVGSGATVELPTRAVPGRDLLVAAAPIPAGRAAVAIVVTDSSGHETTLGLPVAPPTGWTTMRIRFEPESS